MYKMRVPNPDRMLVMRQVRFAARKSVVQAPVPGTVPVAQQRQLRRCRRGSCRTEVRAPSLPGRPAAPTLALVGPIADRRRAVTPPLTLSVLCHARAHLLRSQAMAQGMGVEELFELTSIDPWWLTQVVPPLTVPAVRVLLARDASLLACTPTSRM